MYEELNKRPASGLDFDASANFDIRIGSILKEMIKMAKAERDVPAAARDINFVDIVDMLKGFLEESTTLTTLKCEIVFFVFEYLLLADIKELHNCELVPKIAEVVFLKYLKRKEFDSAVNFCKFLSRKFEAIHKGRANKKAKFMLPEGVREHFKIFCLYFVFQNEYFMQRLTSPPVPQPAADAMQEEAPNQPPQPEHGTQPVDEESAKTFTSICRNFMKVINTLGLYDKKLDCLREFLGNLRCSQLLQSLQLFLAGIFTRFKSEEAHNTEEKALRAIADHLGGPIVDAY